MFIIVHVPGHAYAFSFLDGVLERLISQNKDSNPGEGKLPHSHYVWTTHRASAITGEKEKNERQGKDFIDIAFLSSERQVHNIQIHTFISKRLNLSASSALCHD